jgi:hypothetical protein
MGAVALSVRAKAENLRRRQEALEFCAQEGQRERWEGSAASQLR